MLTIISHTIVEPSQIEEVKKTMLEQVKKTLQADGCHRCELHQDNNINNKFIFIESWRTMGSWRKHMRSDVIKQFNREIDGRIIDFDVNLLNELAMNSD
ncbi:MAG: putative quinol monooxygenase [Pseudomonadota bacterium]